MTIVYYQTMKHGGCLPDLPCFDATLFPAGPDLVGAEVAEELVQLQDFCAAWDVRREWMWTQFFIVSRKKYIEQPMKTYENLWWNTYMGNFDNFEILVFAV